MSKSIIVDEVEALQLEVTNARKTKTTLKDKIDEIDNNINTNTTNIGTLANLTTTTKTNLVNAVNEHDAEIGNLSTLTTTQKGSLVESVNELDGEIGTLSGLNTTLKGNLVEAINEIKSNVGGIDYTVTGVPSNLTTTDKTTLVAAINEHEIQIGDLTTLTTTEKTNLVGATNELVSSVADIATDKLANIIYVNANYTDTQINTLIASLTSGGSVVFKNGTYSGNYVLDIPNVDLIGQGSVISGTITVGKTDIAQKMYSSISGFSFIPTDQENGTSIYIRNTKRFTIDKNTFTGGGKSIYCKNTLTTDHSSEVIFIQNNIMEEMDYCLYVDAPDGYVNTNLPYAEFNFSNNPSTKPHITTIHIATTMDGLLVENNTFYMPPVGDTGHRFTKLHHLYIAGLCDFLTITGNNFFESGQESIVIDYTKDGIINNNNFGWNCEAGLYSVIKLNNSYGSISAADFGRLEVSGNIFRRFARHCVEADSNAQAYVNFVGNIINFDPAFSAYYGTDNNGNPLLSSINHYGLYMPYTGAKTNIKNCKASNNLINFTDNTTYNNVFESYIYNANRKTLRENRWYGSSLLDSTITVTASTALNICTLANMEIQNLTFCGLINITCKSTIAGDGYTTNYLLSVAKSSVDSTGTITQVVANGKTTGASSHEPSFVFSLDSSNHLVATPQGVTAGSFYLSLQAFGDIMFV